MIEAALGIAMATVGAATLVVGTVKLRHAEEAFEDAADEKDRMEKLRDEAVERCERTIELTRRVRIK